jgi:predicted  nucleic acid-binding Zn-ribbon protein
MEQEARDIPARKQQERDRLEEHRKQLADAENELKGTQAEIKKLDLETEAGREKISKFRQQQLEIKTNKEFRAMENEIQAVEHDILGLEDRELQFMEELESRRADVAEKKKALDAEQAAVAADVKALDERLSQLGTELEQVRAARDGVAGEVDPAWRKAYERILGRRDRALVRIEGGVCGGCHMKLPPYVIHDAKRQTEMVSCDFCGRLLYEGD